MWARVTHAAHAPRRRPLVLGRRCITGIADECAKDHGGCWHADMNASGGSCPALCAPAPGWRWPRLQAACGWAHAACARRLRTLPALAACTRRLRMPPAIHSPCLRACMTCQALQVGGKMHSFSACKDNLPAYKVGGWVGGVEETEGPQADQAGPRGPAARARCLRRRRPVHDPLPRPPALCATLCCVPPFALSAALPRAATCPACRPAACRHLPSLPPRCVPQHALAHGEPVDGIPLHTCACPPCFTVRACLGGLRGPACGAAVGRAFDEAGPGGGCCRCLHPACRRRPRVRRPPRAA